MARRLTMRGVGIPPMKMRAKKMKAIITLHHRNAVVSKRMRMTTMVTMEMSRKVKTRKSGIPPLIEVTTALVMAAFAQCHQS